MAAVAHNPAFAKKVGIPTSVGRDFNQADKGKKFREGGTMKNNLFKGKETYSEELKEAKAIKSGKITPEQYARGEKKEESMKKMASGGSTGKPYTYPDSTPVDEPVVKAPKPQVKAPVKSTPVKYPKDVPVDDPVRYARGGGIESRGKTKGKIVKMATGGFVRVADGIAQRGKTKATQIKMKRGGMC